MKMEKNIVRLLNELFESISRNETVTISAVDGIVSLTHDFEDTPSVQGIAPLYEINLDLRRALESILSRGVVI